jgi:hypothetical protein
VIKVINSVVVQGCKTLLAYLIMIIVDTIVYIGIVIQVIEERRVVLLC